MFSCVSAPPTLPSTVWRIPEGFRIVGYFPSWSGDPKVIRYKALTHINYAFALVDPSGDFRPVEAPEKLGALVAKAHSSGVKVLISIGGWNEGDTSAFGAISSDPDRIQNFVQRTVDFLTLFHLDGVDLDWEFPDQATSAGYTALVQTLSDTLRPRGWRVSLAVTATDDNGQFISQEALQAADWINVMAYDDGYGQPAAVPHSSYFYTRAALDYWLKSRQVPASKVILGVPFYGRSLIDRHARTYRSLVQQFPAAVVTDVAGGFNFNGPETIRAKVVNQARLRAGGVMIWQLNQDAQGSQSLLSLIYETVKEPVEDSHAGNKPLVLEHARSEQQPGVVRGPSSGLPVCETGS